MPIPSGYYRSKMFPNMIFKQRHDVVVPSDLASRGMSARVIRSEVTDDPYAQDGKRLTSEDASRYGIALSSGQLREYFGWRSSVGLSWWIDVEARIQSPANDNSQKNNEAAA